MGTKMLSAAGARNMRSRVRNDAPRKERNSGGNDDSKENRSNGLLRRSANRRGRENDADANDQQPRRSKSLNIKRVRLDDVKARGRNGVDRVRLTGRNGVERMRQTTTSAADRVKRTTSSGVDRVRQTGRNGVQTIKSKAPRPLPNRSLFQHKPRTWMGTKKERGNKVKEDWRNARPGDVKKKSIDATKKSARKEEERFERSLTAGSGNGASCSGSKHHVGRSRSAPSKVAFGADEAVEDWRQYLVDEDLRDM